MVGQGGFDQNVMTKTYDPRVVSRIEPVAAGVLELVRAECSDPLLLQRAQAVLEQARLCQASGWQRCIAALREVLDGLEQAAGLR